MIFIQDINCLISFILWTPKSLEVHTCRIGPKPTMGIGIISMARPQAEAIGRTEAATARAAMMSTQCGAAVQCADMRHLATSHTGPES